MRRRDALQPNLTQPDTHAAWSEAKLTVSTSGARERAEDGNQVVDLDT